MRRRYSRNYRGPWRGTLRNWWRADGWRGVLAWWADCPWRRAYAWRVLLFESGQGWLRWGMEARTGYDYIGDGMHAPYPYTVGPPLRRLWLYLRQWLAVPRLMVFGMPPDDITPRRYRFSWEEVQPIWPSDLCDPERGEAWS